MIGIASALCLVVLRMCDCILMNHGRILDVVGVVLHNPSQVVLWVLSLYLSD
jgi:hypothetical protein